MLCDSSDMNDALWMSFFFFFFWVTGEMSILWQSTDRDTELTLDEFHPFDSRCDVSFKLLVCSGHHVSLRLLSLHLCNESPSLPKKKRKKKEGTSQYGLTGLDALPDRLGADCGFELASCGRADLLL